MPEDKNSKYEAINPPATSTIFRRQALEAASVKIYGGIIIAQPMAFSILTYIFLFIAVIIIVFLFTFSTVRKVQCVGIVIPDAGLVRLVTAQNGVVKEKRIKEGQAVKAGDVLFVLSNERFNSEAVGAQRRISDLIKDRKNSLDMEIGRSGHQFQQRLLTIDKRLANLKFENQRLDEQIILQKQRIHLSEMAWNRFRDLHATNYISTAQLHEKQADLLDQRHRLTDLERAKSVIGRDVEIAKGELQDLQIQSRRDAASIQRSIFELEQEFADSESRREIFIKAPQNGGISSITTDLGQTVMANQSLASLLPAHAKLEIEIYLNSKAIGFIQPGMNVIIRFHAYPYQKFGQYRAAVKEISNTSIHREDLPLQSSAHLSALEREPLYRIRLKLDKQTIQVYGKEMPLKSGMLVDASIQLQKRRLYEWIFEPLYSITGKVQ